MKYKLIKCERCKFSYPVLSSQNSVPLHACNPPEKVEDSVREEMMKKRYYSKKQDTPPEYEKRKERN